MRAAVLERAGRPLVLRERKRPEAAPGEVLVKVRACGICHSELDIVEEPDHLPLVPGHEIAGEVAGIGRVLVHPAWGCGACALCERGEDALCPDAEFPGFERDGGFAEWVVVPGRRHLFPIADLDPVEACVLSDAAVTPYRALRRLRDALRTRDPDPGATLVIVGAGGLGQFAIQLARILLRMRIVVVEKDPAKRKIAAALGAAETLPARAKLPRAQAVLDLVGTEETLASSVRALEPGGVLMLVGAAGGTIPFGLEEHPFEIQMLTSINGSKGDLADVLGLVRRGLLRWQVEAVPLDRADEALSRVRRGDVRGRLVLEMWPEDW